MLTKEECLGSLDWICYNCDPYGCVKTCIAYERLEQLINEHFDNPPLKFEDLKEGMWVWDNLAEKYRQIKKLVFYTRGNYMYFELDADVDDWDYFEENRFYRYQLEE